MKRILLVLVGLIALVVVVFGSLYQFVGLKEYLTFKSYLTKSLGKSETEKVTKEFFYGQDSESIGGVVAYIGNNGLWLWTKNNLRYFKFYPIGDGQYKYIRGCTPEGLKSPEYEKAGDINSFRTENYTNIDTWRELVKVGQHVFVKGSKVFVVNPDVKVGNYPLMFCYAV